MLAQCREFKESKQYRIKVKLPVKEYHYHVSQIDPGLGLLIVEVNETPQYVYNIFDQTNCSKRFLCRKVGSKDWTECTDFTTNQQAIDHAHHVLLANDSSLRYIAYHVKAPRIYDLDTDVRINGQIRSSVAEEKNVFADQEKGENQLQGDGCCIQ